MTVTTTPATPTELTTATAAEAPTANAAGFALPAAYGSCPYDPPPGYTTAAAAAPVSRAELPDGAPCWLVTGHPEVRAVLGDARFSADARTPGFPFLSAGQRQLATAQPSFIRMDDPEHARLRRMVAKDFLSRRIQELRPTIVDVVESAVDTMTADGRRGADLVADFALPIPSLVICLMLGVPYEDHALFQSLSRTLLDNTTDPARAAAAHRELMGYLAELAGRKREAPGDDILSRLAVRPDLTAQETASLGFMLLITGHESTTNMAALCVLALLRRPDQAALLRTDPGLIPGAVEELLRYLTIIHLGLGRAATEDVTVGGADIRAGEGVICMLSTANRQPELFGPEGQGEGAACPTELDVTRDARRHVAFGHGVHQCLGHTLARVELQIVLETVLRRLPGLRLAVPEERLVFQRDTIVYGLRELPVTW
ncbi:cytochrome P450 [Streptomyces sp. NBC_00424]|uniref:cytochrome P450 n=1 Tax=Streptomyces sp. NBC_00424 TaxID=2903648 RepID=UPI00225B48DF|nr:cytochrome P450 [Streptomyces sp. NBC_00424]MCX5078116.1 cytochrome P450 [Streptomyces sp. NBC_00424]